MKIATWNIEWMNNWFVGHGQVAFRERYEPRGRPDDAIDDVDDLCTRVAQVIRALDADVLCIQEGPSDIREMQLFVSTYLADAFGQSEYDVWGGIDGGAQKIYILTRRDGALQDPHEPVDALTRHLGDPWLCDIEGTATLASYEFTRRPVVIEGTYEGQPLRVISLHTKSKYVHNGASLWSNPDRRPEFIQEALKHRRRISAESMRVRRYLDDLLAQDPHAAIVLTGDCNDGPGADYFEAFYLTHNITDILMGSLYRPATQFEHAFMHRMREVDRYTAIFDDFVTGETGKKLVLDHIMVSPVLRSGGGSRLGLLNAEIAHRAFEAAIDPDASSSRQRYPSDHRPAVAVFGP
ncbi:MAG: endonuclease/exonuclease/phosphatase family protein [Anaerolineae bacterium]